MSADIAIACRLLPAMANKIKELADRDEAFQDLCEDLAVAELALARLRKLEEPLIKQRLAEYEDLVTSLTAEIKDTVDRAELLRWPRKPGR